MNDGKEKEVPVEDKMLADRLAELVKSWSKSGAYNTVRAKRAHLTKARISGDAYVTMNGKKRPKRQLGPTCLAHCHRNCYRRISHDEREAIFANFWSLRDRTAQWQYIADNVFFEPILKNRGVESRRGYSRFYHFYIEDRVEQVCKVMFLNTLGITNSWLITVSKKLRVNGCITPDERTNHRIRTVFKRKITRKVKESSPDMSD